MEEDHLGINRAQNAVSNLKFTTNIIDHFPYTPYPTQIEACNDIQKAIKDGKTDIVLEAPTGSGKSPIAIAISKWIEHELEQLDESIRPQSSSFILTAEKILQNQYTMEFDYLACAKGRGNYRCQVLNATCAQGRCRLTNKYCDQCEYKIALYGAASAQISMLNYHVFLYVTKHGNNPFDARPVMILDEAHKVEEILMGFVDLQITQEQLNKIDIDLIIPDHKNIEDYVDWIGELHSETGHRAEEIKTYWRSRIEEIKRSTAVAQLYKKEMKKKEQNESLEYKSGVLLNAIKFNPKDWVIKYDRNDKKLIAKPIYVRRYHQRFIVPYATIKIYMSATISDYNTFCSNMGIDIVNAAFVEMPHTFPIENRPIYYHPVGKMSMKFKRDTMPKLANAIGNIIAQQPDYKGIVHTFTWELNDFLIQNLNGVSDRIMTHESNNRDDQLGIFTISDEPLVMLSPSMYTGVDLKNDLSRFAIICKIPFGMLTDVQIKARKNIDPDWYDVNIITKLLQAYGRSIRNIDDWCTTYILDESFEWFYDKVHHMFPQYFHDALKRI